MVTWLDVRYDEKDKAKALGARWSAAEKCGAGQGDFPMSERVLDKFMTAERDGVLKGVTYEPIVITITKEDLTDPPYEFSSFAVSFPNGRVFTQPDEDEEPVPLDDTHTPGAFASLRAEFRRIFKMPERKP